MKSLEIKREGVLEVFVVASGVKRRQTFNPGQNVGTPRKLLPSIPLTMNISIPYFFFSFANKQQHDIF